MTSLARREWKLLDRGLIRVGGGPTGGFDRTGIIDRATSPITRVSGGQQSCARQRDHFDPQRRATGAIPGKPLDGPGQQYESRRMKIPAEQRLPPSAHNGVADAGVGARRATRGEGERQRAAHPHCRMHS